MTEPATLLEPASSHERVGPLAPDATDRSGARGIVCALLCASVIFGAAWWAFARPLRGLHSASGSGPDASPVATAAAQTASESIDLAAFGAPLWVAPPAPPPAIAAPAKPTPEPPPPQLKWQLLAIVGGGVGGGGTSDDPAALRAMVYDPEADEVVELSVGQQRGSGLIESISNGRVAVRIGRHAAMLSLEDPEKRGGK